MTGKDKPVGFVGYVGLFAESIFKIQRAVCRFCRVNQLFAIFFLYNARNYRKTLQKLVLLYNPYSRRKGAES